MRLSELMQGSKFFFVAGQIARYAGRTPTSPMSDLETNSYTCFEVIKKSPKTIKCKAGNVEYNFRIGVIADAGTATGSKKNMAPYTGIDCEVISVKK